MPAPATANNLLDLIRKSEILAPDRIDEFLLQVPNREQLSATDLAGRLVRDGLLTGFQANHLLKGRYKNFHIGKFKVMEPLGSGGMSQVYLCEHRQMRHRVALKMLPIKESTDPAAVSRFLREARAAASVNHPNVVRAHDFDQADGKFYYLIMDYVDGVNLHDLVRNAGPLAPEQAAHYMAQAADGLQHIGDNGLIHRDLKPSNLLLDRTGVIRILDLGLARFTDDDKDNITRQFQNSTVMGTADYLAPEQAMMMDGLDIRADIYSLGATFYFLLSGHAPFETAGVTQKLIMHQLNEPDTLPDSVPAGMRAVVERMMRKKPEDRFQQPHEIIDALAEWTALPLPPPEDAWFPRRSGVGGPRTGANRPGPPSTSGHGNKTSTSGRMAQPEVVPPGPRPASGRLAAAVVAPVVASKSRMRLLIGGGIAAAVLVAGLAAVLLGPSPKPETVAAPPPSGKAATPPVTAGPLVPTGSVVVSASGPVKTIQQALEIVEANGKILLADATHAETVTVDSPKPGVTIQGWPDERPTAWTAPSGSSAGTPLIRIESAAGFTLANVALDGGDKTLVLVKVAGICPGTLLDRVSAIGYKSAAIELKGCVGDPTRPVRVRKLFAHAADPAAVGVRVAAAAEGSPNRHLAFDTCRFDGLATGIEATGAADPLAVTFCRFSKLGAAIDVPGTTPPKFDLTFTNNTVAECKTGLRFAAVPLPSNTLTATNNLFFKTDRMTESGSVTGVPTFDPPLWVWHDEGLTKERSTIIPAGLRYFRKTFDLPAVPAGPVRLDIGCAAAFRVWVNGEKVGESSPRHFTKRVYAFEVGKLLMPGANLIAVEGTNTTDPIRPSFASAAGLTVRVSAGAGQPLVATDESWVSSEALASGWERPGFGDAAWKPVKAWETVGFNMPWRGSVWDAAVAEQLGKTPPPTVVAAGNVRDYLSNEGYPLLDSVRGSIPDDFTKNPDDDAVYLRTPIAAVPNLRTAGTNNSPVGVPAGR